MNATHELKTISPYFQRVWDCTKTFEVRKNDRDFQGGDVVKLMEYDAEKQQYSGRICYADILYVLSNYPQIDKDYCVFSIVVREWIDPANKKI